MIRGAVGNYTSVTDYDEWRFGSAESRSSLIKFSPTIPHCTRKLRKDGENDVNGH